MGEPNPDKPEPKRNFGLRIADCGLEEPLRSVFFIKTDRFPFLRNGIMLEKYLKKFSELRTAGAIRFFLTKHATEHPTSRFFCCLSWI